MAKHQRKGGHYRHPIWDEFRRQGRYQTWAAEVTGYSYGHIRSMSCGRMPTSKPFAAKLAEAIGVDIDKIIAADEAKKLNEASSNAA